MTPEQKEARDAVRIYGSQQKAADALGISRSTLRGRLDRGKRWDEVDPAIAAAAKAGGLESPEHLGFFWKKGVKDEEGNEYSLCIKNPNTGSEQPLVDMISQSIDRAFEDRTPPNYEPRPEPTGEHLLIVDLADVHFLKLCVKTETGYEYNREIARHRVIEGIKALLRDAKVFGLFRILFVLGNDILNVDGPHGKTTSGTPQDNEGTVFQGYSDAFIAVRDAVELCADEAPTDLVHCMSNHDWTLGWALSREVATWFRNHPNVHATDYNLSERHRKYYGFGNSAFQIHHADGAKEEKLLGLFNREARFLVGKCKLLYSLCHHLHHKIRKRRGVDVFVTEKDHTGITAIMTGAAATEGDLNIEYIRSPSPPDGWHDRNGYVNRQAVECFIVHPEDGITKRFTEWF